MDLSECTELDLRLKIMERMLGGPAEDVDVQAVWAELHRAMIARQRELEGGA